MLKCYAKLQQGREKLLDVLEGIRDNPELIEASQFASRQSYHVNFDSVHGSMCKMAMTHTHTLDYGYHTHTLDYGYDTHTHCIVHGSTYVQAVDACGAVSAFGIL